MILTESSEQKDVEFQKILSWTVDKTRIKSKVEIYIDYSYIF